jgi:uncharacterized protein (TIGR02453 family)
MTSAAQQPRAGQAFSPALFDFLRELRQHNDREWFNANKRRYQEDVQEPALAFIADFAPRLAAISPHFVADPRPQGGSLFRIYRDTRFAKDKSPYKTHTGIQFRHEQGRDVHAPGFYLHLEPGSVFVGAGIWRPDTTTLASIREAIDSRPEQWTQALRESRIGEMFELEGDSLKRPPSGYDVSHPRLDDLKRKDFIAVAKLEEETVTSPGFVDELAATLGTASPFVRFLCEATGVRFD